VSATRRGVNPGVNMPHFHTLWGFASVNLDARGRKS
jgi:hypothetical protein